VGTPEKYMAAHFDILDKKVAFNFPYRRTNPNIYIGEGAKYKKSNLTSGPVVVGKNTVIDEDVKLLPRSVIGSSCNISKGTSVSGSIIFDNCNIGNSCIIRDSIIAGNVNIGDNVKIEGNSVVGDNTVIDNDNILRNGIKINVNSHIEEGQISF
jgi:NDP-sugar pyrophosphorylase family protein